MIRRPSARFFCTSGTYPGNVLSISDGMPQTPSGGGCMTPPMSPFPIVRVSIKAWRSKLSATARRRSGSLNGGVSRFIITLRLTLTGTSWQIASGAWFFTLLTTGTCKKKEVISTLPAPNAQHTCRDVLDDLILDAVEVGPALLPVVRVSRDFDRLVRLEFDKFERAGADGIGAHIARADMAGIDR